jgi:hypothetical protein
MLTASVTAQVEQRKDVIRQASLTPKLASVFSFLAPFEFCSYAIPDL